MTVRPLMAAAMLAGSLASVLAPARAQAPTAIAPPAAEAPAATPAKPAPKPVPRKPPAGKPVATDIPPALAPVSASARDPDLAFGAFQRGYYLTALQIATQRVNEKGDVKSMTLLGELYANGFGVARDDNKAVEWYRMAADRGDREAMFALAMFRLAGRGG